MSIYINISASKDTSTVSWGGVNVAVISTQEMDTFKLNKRQLEDAVKNGGWLRPNDAYLRKPTPWGLYDKYTWPETQRGLYIQGSKVLERSSKPVIVATKEFKNESSVPVTFNAGIEQSVENTVSSQWSTGGSLSVGQTISYNVGFLGSGGGGETSMNYEQSWGIGGERSKTTTVGSSAGVEVELQPGQAVIVELIATRGILKIEFEYIASLKGIAALNYNPPYKGAHFHGVSVPLLMKANDISNAIKSREVVEIDFFSESKITVKDKYNDKLIKEVDTSNLRHEGFILIS